MIAYYDVEELSNKVDYVIRGTYLFGKDKLVIDYVAHIGGGIFGNTLLQAFTEDLPIALEGRSYTCIEGAIQIDRDDDSGDIEEIRVLNNVGRVVCCFYDIETMQQYLVGVEIAEFYDLEK